MDRAQKLLEIAKAYEELEEIRNSEECDDDYDDGYEWYEESDIYEEYDNIDDVDTLDLSHDNNYFNYDHITKMYIDSLTRDELLDQIERYKKLVSTNIQYTCNSETRILREVLTDLMFRESNYVENLQIRKDEEEKEKKVGPTHYVFGGEGTPYDFSGDDSSLNPDFW